MPWFDRRPKAYVPVAQRKEKATRESSSMAKRGERPEPVVLSGKAIASSFWGKSWCENLERYSDYENRLPRGRSYLRNGAVVDLKIKQGLIEARVIGSSVYKVEVTVQPIPAARWEALCSAGAGNIASILDLLAGKFSDGVMSQLCEPRKGLFPEPRELSFFCSCPDWAAMCKHVAATLYGVGNRLDHQPELMFLLRHVNPSDMIRLVQGQSLLPNLKPGPDRLLAVDDLSALFGMEIEDIPEAPPPPQTAPAVLIPGLPLRIWVTPAPSPAPTFAPKDILDVKQLATMRLQQTHIDQLIADGHMLLLPDGKRYGVMPDGWAAILKVMP
jgi:uncharacterized Zn finger protein